MRVGCKSSKSFLLPNANHVFLDLPPHITLPKGCCRMSARGCQTRDIVQWILSHRPFPILRHLSLEIFPENTTYMCIFLEAASETLEWLEISYDFSHWPGEQVTIECFSPISQHPIEAGMGWRKPSFTYGPSHTSIEKSSGQPMEVWFSTACIPFASTNLFTTPTFHIHQLLLSG